MAIDYMEGFEHGHVAGWTTAGGTLSAATDAPGTGTYSLKNSTGGSTPTITKILATPLSTAVLAARWRVQNISANFSHIGFYNSTNVAAAVYLNADGHIYLKYRGGDTAPFTGVALAVDTYYHIQIKIVVHATLGSIEVKLDGDTIITVTNADTRPGGSLTTVDRIVCRQGSLSAVWVDDVIVDDADFPGDLRVVGLVPTADGNYTAWTPSIGTDHYATIDEKPPSDTDYNEVTTAAQRDSYGTSDLAIVGAAEIVAAQIVGFAHEAVATGNTLDFFYRIGGVDYDDGVAEILSISMQPVRGAIHEVSPATGVAWTEAEINALEIGVLS